MKSKRIGRIPVRVVPGIAALLILILRTTLAQLPAGQTAPPATSIKVSTRLVTVDVVAQDKKNRSVEGLTKDDFELLEDGRPQTLSVFSVEGSQAPPASSATAPSHGVQPGPLPPGAFTNRPTRASDIPGSATVILLDELNTSAKDLALARVQAAKFIRQLQPQDRVALYAMGGELRVVQEFTNDPSLLLKALENTRPQPLQDHPAKALNVPILGPGGPKGPQVPGSDTANPAPSGGFEVTGNVANIEASFSTYQRVDMTVQAFQAIGEHLAQIPGRKTLIWISFGIPLTIETVGPDRRATPDKIELTLPIQRACRVLSRYNVAVYPIDARGQATGINDNSAVTWDGPTGRNLKGAGWDGGTRPSALSGGSNIKDMNNTQGSGHLLAQLTGGRTFYNENDMALAMRTAIDDSNLIYVLGYYPDQEKWDSKFHTFKVRVKQSGVKLLYRTGYLAVPEEQNSNPADPASALGRVVLSPLDSTAIGLRAQLQKAQPLTIDLRVDVNDLLLNHNDEGWHGDIEIVIAQRGPGGDVVGEGARKHSVELNLKEDYYTQLKAEGLSLFFPFARDPHAVQLKVVVRDTSSGAMGSVGIPLDKTE